MCLVIAMRVVESGAEPVQSARVEAALRGRREHRAPRDAPQRDGTLRCSRTSALHASPLAGVHSLLYCI